jgi:methyl-accepting chemotaxis protein
MTLNRLRIRTRLLIATLVPVLITAATIAWITASQIQENGEAELQRLENNLLDARKTGLKNLIDAVKAVVLEAKNNPAFSEEEAKTAATARIRTIRFDNANYVFAYQRDVFNLAYAPDPSKEGPTSNPAVRKLIGALFDAAESQGFYEYLWPNPASGNEESKVSYSTVIPGWDWLVGAGVYTTDIDKTVALARADIESRIASTLGFILLATVIVVVISLGIGILVGRTVTTPLKTVSDMMGDIANGEGDLRHRLPEEGTDELSVMGHRFNAFVVKIQDTMREVGITTD